MFLYSQVDGGVDLYGANITGELACEGTTLLNPDGRALELTSATVKRDLTLRSAKGDNGQKIRFHARGEVCLHGAKIDGTMSCSGGLFEASASDEYESAISAQFVKIGGYAHLRRSPVTGEVFQAIGPVDFHGAEIGGECVFDDAIITPDLRPRITPFARSRPAFRIDASRIGEEFSLDRASITGGAVFDRATIEGDLSIVGTSLEAVTPRSSDQKTPTLSLAFSQVRGRLVWGPKKISGPVSLCHAEFGMLDDEKGAWSGCRVELSGLKYSGLGEKGAAWSYKERLEWLDSSESKTESQPYDQIIRVFRDSGRENDAREIAIEKQRRLRAFARSSGRRLYRWLPAIWSWFLRGTIAYGYKPWKALRLALLFVVAGTFVFYTADRNHAMMPTSNWARPQPSSEEAAREPHGERASYASRVYIENGYPQFIAPIYALDTLLPVINLRQRDFWLPNPINWFGWVALVYMWIETLAGWVLASALVAALSGLVKRES